MFLCFHSPGSQQGGVPLGPASVSHLHPGELGWAQSTQRSCTELQAAVEREPIWKRAGQTTALCFVFFVCVCFVCCVFLTVFECIWLCPTVSLCLTVWVCLTMSGCVWLCPTVSVCLTVCLNYVSDCLIISHWLCPTVCRVWRWTDRTTKWKDSISSQSILFELRPSIGTDQERPLRRSASPHTQTVSSNYVCL